MPTNREEPETTEGDLDVSLEVTTEEGYCIRVAARKSGLSIDTLRMWERRYGFPSPLRNAAGNRLYTESDIERLSLVARALQVGYRTGEAIRLAPATLRELLSSRSSVLQPLPSEPVQEIETLLDRLSSNDPEGLRRDLRRYAGALGAKDFVVRIAGPLAVAVGNAWQNGELHVHHEHLLSYLLSTELRLLGLTQELLDGPLLILATPPREYHSLGIEMAALYARTLGVRAHVLGVDLPAVELVRGASALRAQAVGLGISLAAPVAAVEAHLRALAEQLPGHVELWLGGTGASSLQGLPNRARAIDSWSKLEDACLSLMQGR